jgi:hypothetical protein
MDVFGIESNAIRALTSLGIQCLDAENIKNWPAAALAGKTDETDHPKPEQTDLPKRLA